MRNVYRIEFKDIFPEESSDIQSYLNGIDKVFILRASHFLLSPKIQNLQFSDYPEHFRRWFSDRSISDQITSIVLSFINEFKRRNPNKELTIFNPYSTLLLLEQIFRQEDSVENSLSDSQIEQNLFKAYLCINQQVNTLDYDAINSTRELPEKVRCPAWILTQTIAYFDIVNIPDLRLIIVCEIIKSYYLFQFLEAEEGARFLYNKYLSYFEINEWRDFLLKYLPVVMRGGSSTDERHQSIVVPRGENHENICAFLDRRTLTTEEESRYQDFVTIRNKPLFKSDTEPGTYHILSNLFAIEKIYKGMYFELSALHEGLPDEEKASRDFRSYYGKEFSEKFLSYRILDKCFPKSFTKMTGEGIVLRGITAGPDYYARFKNKIFLFESKDTLLTTEIKHCFDFRRIESELRTKLYGNSSSPKAILQIVNNIKNILKGRFTIDNINLPQARIYPILILHHPVYETSGLNAIISYWFKEELHRLKVNENLNISSVKGLSIINIDFFVLYQDCLQKRQLKLEKLLDGYLDQVYSFPYNAFSVYIDSIKKRGNLSLPPRLFKDQTRDLISPININNS